MSEKDRRDSRQTSGKKFLPVVGTKESHGRVESEGDERTVEDNYEKMRMIKVTVVGPHTRSKL